MEVTSIDFPLFSTSMQLIVQDENKHFINLAIYGLGNKISQLLIDYKIGCKLIINNPFYRFKALDGFPLIKMENPKSVLITGYEKRC